MSLMLGFVLAALQAGLPGPRVTAVHMRLSPETYSGPCPGHVKLVAEITTDGPGTVWYRFLAGAVSNSPEGTLAFQAAGTKTVTLEGTFRVTPRVPHASLIAAMQDSAGRHGPRTVSSGPVNYNITCAGQAAPLPTAASPIRLPEGTTVEAQYKDGTAIRFRPGEEVAFVYVLDIRSLQSDPCGRALNRLCSMEELLRGVSGKDGRVVGFKRSPLQDPNYGYRLTVATEKYQIEAAPKRPGLGGFLVIGDKIGFSDFYYNPNGPATIKDKKLGSYGVSGDDLIAR